MLLPVPHHKQMEESDCLAACAAMALAYIGQPVPYRQLLTVLDVGPVGAPRRNIVRLTSSLIDVAYREANIPLLAEIVQHGLPVIVFVDTGELPYWSYATSHAVVVVGVQAEQIFVNDPAFSESPIQVPAGDFDLAWLNSDYMCAILSRR